MADLVIAEVEEPMSGQIDWPSITMPLDVKSIEVRSHHLRRWLGFERTGLWLSFRCELANDQQVVFEVDLVEADIVRVRMSQERSATGRVTCSSLMSTPGYGLFVHSSYPIVFGMGGESSISYSIHVADDHLDDFLIYIPDLKWILKRYADLTGHAPVPPKWSSGLWVSRAGYRSREEVEMVVSDLMSIRSPYSGEC
jgi:hypothetical protein